MNTAMYMLIGILVIAGMCGLVVAGMYNGLVSASVEIDNQWSQVKVQLQRRADLIPNLESVTKAYMEYEKELLIKLVEAREEWKKSMAGTIEEQVRAGAKLDGVIGEWLLTVENYPDLKASEVFLTLMDELAGTENRIAVARGRYNKAVANYNVAIRTFPTNLIANMFGFYPRPFYMGNEGIEEVPEVFA